MHRWNVQSSQNPTVRENGRIPLLIQPAQHENVLHVHGEDLGRELEFLEHGEIEEQLVGEDADPGPPLSASTAA